MSAACPPCVCVTVLLLCVHHRRSADGASTLRIEITDETTSGGDEFMLFGLFAGVDAPGSGIDEAALEAPSGASPFVNLFGNLG